MFRTWSVMKIMSWYIGSLHLVIALLAALTFQFYFDAQRAQKPVTVYLPDTVKGTYVETGTPPSIWIYRFAYQVWLGLHTWDDGELDYYENLLAASPLLTHRCRVELESEIQRANARGTHRNVMRRLAVDSDYRYHPSRVTALGEGDGWRVELVLKLTESVNGSITKDTTVVRYLYVVPLEVSTDLNPSLLGLDCSDVQRSRRLEVSS